MKPAIPYLLAAAPIGGPVGVKAVEKRRIIAEKGTFANAVERGRVRDVPSDAIAARRKRIERK
jgi:hypothetical protein